MTEKRSSGTGSVSTSFAADNWDKLGIRNASLFGALLGGTVTRVDKPWGREFVVATEEFLLKVIEVFAGCRTSLQHHEKKTEIHWLMSGTGELFKEESDQDERELYQVKSEMRPSPGLLVQPGEVHRAIGPLLILEISTNHPDDVVRHQDDYAREDVDAG
jgi:mannose-6-phosphate isomerase